MLIVRLEHQTPPTTHLHPPSTAHHPQSLCESSSAYVYSADGRGWASRLDSAAMASSACLVATCYRDSPLFHLQVSLHVSNFDMAPHCYWPGLHGLVGKVSARSNVCIDKTLQTPTQQSYGCNKAHPTTIGSTSLLVSSISLPFPSSSASSPSFPYASGSFLSQITRYLASSHVCRCCLHVGMTPPHCLADCHIKSAEAQLPVVARGTS